MKLTEEIFTIYESMRPTLKSIALKYRVKNTNETVDVFLAKAFFIAKKFDDGDLVKEGFTSGDNELTPVTSDDPILFLKFFRSYLVTAFKNDLNQEWGKNKKFDSNVDLEIAASSVFVGTEPASIDEIREVVLRDVKKSANPSSPTQACTAAFYRSVEKALDSIQLFLGSNEQVIANLSAKNANDFFVLDFKSLLQERIKFFLAKEALVEECPLSFDKIASFLFSDSDMALDKKMSRYVFETQGGWGKRIKRGTFVKT